MCCLEKKSCCILMHFFACTLYLSKKFTFKKVSCVESPSCQKVVLGFPVLEQARQEVKTFVSVPYPQHPSPGDSQHSLRAPSLLLRTRKKNEPFQMLWSFPALCHQRAVWPWQTPFPALRPRSLLWELREGARDRRSLKLT